MSQIIRKIYKITNLVNDKIYIGQTKQRIERRFQQHTRSPYLIGKAIRKHGEDIFNIEVLLIADDLNYVNKIEQDLIKAYGCIAPNGYNLATGGKNFNHSEETLKKFKERTFSEETIAKIVESRKGYTHSDETKYKMRERALGRGHTEETCEKLRKINTGKKLSDDHKKAISASLKGRISWTTPVYCSTLGVAFDSAKEAANELSVNHSSIIRICKGKQKSTTCGLVFEYIKEG